jgi:hypothetical protein
MINLEAEKFQQVATAAFERAKNAPKDATRWANAITKAAEFLSTNALWHLMDDDVLLLVSSQSFEVYEVGEDSCERIDGDSRVYCPAFEKGKFPCWHRAARRLLLLYAADAE